MKISTVYYQRYLSLRAACLLLILIGSLVGLTHTARAATTAETPAAGERVITIYDQGRKRVVLTKASSVKETLEQADVTLSKYDRVEPALDSKYATQSSTVNIYRARPVMIVEGMKREQVLSPYSAAKDIAKDAGLTIQNEDILTLSRSEDVLTDGVGSKLEIDRAAQLNLVLYGKSSRVYTQEKTVEALLREKEITLGKDDTLSLAANTPITQGMTIEVWRDGVQTATEQQPVEFPIEQIEDADREVGYREIKTPGVKGEKTVTYEVTMKNGQEVARKEIQSVVTKEPQKQVEVVGSKPSFDGDFAAALAQLRSCEGSYNSWNPAGPYYGAYQFNEGTWNSVSSACATRLATMATLWCKFA
ncbi:MAG: transglycosylase-like protein [Candidatus Saccharibacteria bacterium GW2011_GWC2_48_9]|nr:MAG: transglycosylase-like protein [Candidatus Saccharibacteria bacterium GW2011_GWC2_48_9]